MAAGIEGAVESYLRRRVVDDCGGMCIKMESGGGIPDRLCVFPNGNVVWVEVKRPKGGRLSQSQVVCHELLRRNAQYVYCVKNKAEVDEMIKVMTDCTEK